MGATPSDYDAVIADLESRILEWQRTIEVLKIMRDHTGVVPLPLPAALTALQPHSPGADFPSDAFFNMSIPDAVKKYLAMVKRKQSTKRIVEALERGGYPHQSKNFYNTVFGVLNRHWKTQGEIVKVGSEWGLAEWYGGARPKEKPKRSLLNVPDDDGSDGPTAKSGE